MSVENLEISTFEHNHYNTDNPDHFGQIMIWIFGYISIILFVIIIPHT